MNAKRSPFGIYIHFPFCCKKCSYCDFYSLPVSDHETLEKYVVSVMQDLHRQSGYFKNREFASLYLGGGTPSLFSAKQLGRIIAEVFFDYCSVEKPEITVEVNPGTVDGKKLRDFKLAGINRLSIGIQSFSRKDLQLLGRIHDEEDSWNTIKAMETSGIDNFNLDFIYGIPGQSLDAWRENLRLAVSCSPRHLSAYLLQLEANTPLARRISRGEIILPDDDLQADMFYTAVDYLQEQGYQHYELSNFSIPEWACHHNMLYWQAEEYLGIGPGAVSFLGGRRVLNLPGLHDYIKSLALGQPVPTEVQEEMEADEFLSDAIILGLRLTGGIKRLDFINRFGVDVWEKYSGPIEDCRQLELLSVDKEGISLTRKGYFLSNVVFCRFIK